MASETESDVLTQNMSQSEMVATAADELGLDVDVSEDGHLSSEELVTFLSEIVERGVQGGPSVSKRAEKHSSDPYQGDFRSGLLAE